MVSAAQKRRHFQGLRVAAELQLAFDFMVVLKIRRVLASTLLELIFFDIVRRGEFFGEGLQPNPPIGEYMRIAVAVVSHFAFQAVGNSFEQLLYF